MAFWALAIVLGFLQAWANRHDVGGDGVNYLDMADAYFRGDWKVAINGLWSPAYAWILGLAMQVIRPTPYWQYPVVHLVSLLLYFGAMWCFEFFLIRLIACQTEDARASDGEFVALPIWIWMVIGYTLFLSSSLDLIGLVWVNPDICVAALVYLAMGLLLEMRVEDTGWRPFLCLGAVLGASFLAKTAMFVIGIGFLCVTWLITRRSKGVGSRLAVAFLIFASIAAPLILAVSHSKGRLTIGESGTLNYAWHVLGIPDRHWQGAPSGSGTPLHPTRRIVASPEVYEFGGPIGGTYPMWYDPSYWYEGLTIHLDSTRQFAALLRNGNQVLSIIFRFYGLLVGAVVLLGLSSRRIGQIGRDFLSQWPIFLPSVAAVGMYVAVHVESRYIGPFVVLLLMGIVASIRLQNGRKEARAAGALALVTLVTFMSPIGPAASRKYYSAVKELMPGRGARHELCEVAEGALAMGLRPGDKIATTSYANFGYVSWARLARVRIVAEVYYRSNLPETLKNNYWDAAPEARRSVEEAVARAGARFLVSDSAPPPRAEGGWTRIGVTGYWIHPIGEVRLSGQEGRPGGLAVSSVWGTRGMPLETVIGTAGIRIRKAFDS